MGRYVHVADQLNKWGFSVRGYDQYGHGESAGLRGELPTDDKLLDDLATVIDDTRARMDDRLPLILLGHSMGGLVAAQVEDLLTLRRIVEPAAAALAAARELSPAEQGRLRQASQDCAAAGVEQYRPFDARLHLVLAELSGSPSLAGVVADVRDRTNAMLDRIPLIPPNLVHSTRQHEAVVGAVLGGAPGPAEEAMRDHLEGTAALLRGFSV